MAALRVLVINSHLLNGRYPPIFVSDVTKPFPGFSVRCTIILNSTAPLAATFAIQCQWENIVVISKMAGVLKDEQGKNGHGRKCECQRLKYWMS